MSDRPFTIRPFGPGDLGLIVSRQAILYRESYGWGYGLEVNEFETAAAFLRHFKPGREQCWVAEIDGSLAGSVLVTDEGGGLARLRLLYVEPRCQGRGIGDALVRTCLAFAREAGFTRMTLWTHSVLAGARRLYTRHGFRLTGTSEHMIFGPAVTGETWELTLTSPEAGPGAAAHPAG